MDSKNIKIYSFWYRNKKHFIIPTHHNNYKITNPKILSFLKKIISKTDVAFIDGHNTGMIDDNFNDKGIEFMETTSTEFCAFPTCGDLYTKQQLEIISNKILENFNLVCDSEELKNINVCDIQHFLTLPHGMCIDDYLVECAKENNNKLIYLDDEIDGSYLLSDIVLNGYDKCPTFDDIMIYIDRIKSGIDNFEKCHAQFRIVN